MALTNPRKKLIYQVSYFRKGHVEGLWETVLLNTKQSPSKI